jgi:ABC-2 type transport system permease protein
MSIVLGKVLGGTILAFGQGLVFLVLAPLIGIHLTVASFAIACAAMIVVSFGLTALGLCIAWPMNSTQGFHAIMNLFLMPMWFLSGALFPVQGAWRGMQIVMAVNPLTYGLAAIRRAIYWNESANATMPSLAMSFGVSVAFSIVMFVVAAAIASRRTRADFE